MQLFASGSQPMFHQRPLKPLASSTEVTNAHPSPIDFYQACACHLLSIAMACFAGSAKAANAAQLAAQPDIDGLLIGGASLLPEFVACCAAFK